MIHTWPSHLRIIHMTPWKTMIFHEFSWISLNIDGISMNIHGKPWHIRQCCPLWPLEFWNTTRLQAQWRVTCLQAHDHAGARRVIVVFVCYCNLTIDFCSLMDIDCVYIYICMIMYCMCLYCWFLLCLYCFSMVSLLVVDCGWILDAGLRRRQLSHLHRHSSVLDNGP